MSHRPLLIGFATLGCLLVLVGTASASSVDVALPDPITVEMVNDGDPHTESLDVVIDNNFDGEMDVSLDYSLSGASSFDTFVDPSDDTVTVPGNDTETVSVLVSIDNDENHDLQQDLDLDVSYTASNESGQQDNGADDTYFDIKHPFNLRLTSDPPSNQLPLGQNHDIPVEANETYGWHTASTISVDQFSCEAPGGSNLDWGVDFTLEQDFVSAGAHIVLGQVSAPVPSTIDVLTFGTDSATCDLQLSHSQGSNSKTVPIDPKIPATLTVSWVIRDSLSFVFDEPIDQVSEYSKSVKVEIENHGDENWNDRPVFTYGHNSDVRFRAGKSISLSGGSRKIVDGKFTVPPAHSEGDFSNSPVIGVGGVPIYNRNLGHLSDDATDQLAYDVTFGARVAREPSNATLDIGSCRIGARCPLTVVFEEQLGYTGVTLTPSQKAGPDTQLKLKLPETVSISKDDSTEVTVVLRPPAGTTSGCQQSWQTSWTPKKDRPKLEPLTTQITATTELANLKEATQALDEWGISNDTVLRQTLSDARGCDVGPDEQEDASRGVRATMTLKRLNTTPTDNLDDLSRASTKVKALELTVSEDDPITGPLIPRYQAARDRIRERLQEEKEAAMDADPTPASVDRLGRLASAYQAVGMDPTPIRARQDEMLDHLRGDYRDARQSVRDLYETRKRAPAGLTVSTGLTVNPNPLNWITVDQMRQEATRDAQRAMSTYADFPQLANRVERAEAEAQGALAQAEDALFLGAFANAVIAVAFAGYGTRAFLRYMRDLEDAQLGADLLG